MKTFWKQFGKASCYFGLYFIMQVGISLIYQMVYGFMAGMQSALSGVPIDVAVLEQDLVAFVYDKAVDMVVISGVLTILTLWLFFLIRKKNVLREANIVRFPVRYVPTLIVLGIGLQAFLAFGGGLLPQEWLESYIESVSATMGTISVISVLAQVVAAPVVEEVIFRGLMLSRLRKAVPDVAAVLITAVIFGLIHGQIYWILYASLLGILFGVIAIQTKSILSTILLHAVFNGAGVIVSALPVDFPVSAYVAFTVGGAAVSAVAAWFLLRRAPQIEG